MMTGGTPICGTPHLVQALLFGRLPEVAFVWYPCAPGSADRTMVALLVMAMDELQWQFKNPSTRGTEQYRTPQHDTLSQMKIITIQKISPKLSPEHRNSPSPRRFDSPARCATPRLRPCPTDHRFTEKLWRLIHLYNM